MTMRNFDEAVAALRSAYETWDAPAKRFAGAYRRTPYTILVSVLLSFRTKDEVTLEADRRLFALADEPGAMVKLTARQIEEAIYPVGFYRRKAQTVLEISRTLLARYDGAVPRTERELLSLKGVGPKAAKIVLESAFGQESVAVDAHVHRILNRWGFLHTRTPEESSARLETMLEPAQKRGLNRLLVSFGQVVCRPVSPHCGECPVAKLCPAFAAPDKKKIKK